MTKEDNRWRAVLSDSTALMRLFNLARSERKRKEWYRQYVITNKDKIAEYYKQYYISIHASA